MSALTKPIMTSPLTILLLAIALFAACSCTPNRTEVVAMRDEPDVAKAVDNLADLIEYLEDVEDPPEPDRRCAMIDVGSDIARRVIGLQRQDAKPGESPAELAERMHAVLRGNLDRPVTESEEDLRDDGFEPAAARSATASWAAWKLGGWLGPADARLLAGALGREDSVADARLQASIAAALLAQAPVLEADRDLAAMVWCGALRVHVRHDAGNEAALRPQLDALDLVVLDLDRLAAMIADGVADDALRTAAVRQADRILCTWLHERHVPERHCASLPNLAQALSDVATNGSDQLADLAAEAAAGSVPWALVRSASARPEGVNADMIRCSALRVMAAAVPALDPTQYMPGVELAGLQIRLVDQVIAALPRLPTSERWPAMPPLAHLAPKQLADRLSTGWEDPDRSADWAPESWLAGIRLVAAHPDLSEPVRRRAAEAITRIVLTPLGEADPTIRWDLAAEITAPWPSLRAQALAGAALAPSAETKHLERLVRILVSAALAIPEDERAEQSGWTAVINALATCAQRDDLETMRPGLRFLLDHAPDRLVEAMRTRATASGPGQQEVVLLVDDALGGGRLPPAIRQGALEWLVGVATSSVPEDVRLVAGAAVLHHAAATDPRRTRIAAALPLLADVESR